MSVSFAFHLFTVEYPLDLNVDICIFFSNRYRTIKRKLAAPVTESPVKIAGGTRPRTSSIDRLVSDLAPIHEDAPLHSPSGSGGSPARSLTQSLPITGRVISTFVLLPVRAIAPILREFRNSCVTGKLLVTMISLKTLPIALAQFSNRILH